eukprot:12078503-Alexandrium_andersonii.AAC.1
MADLPQQGAFGPSRQDCPPQPQPAGLQASSPPEHRLQNFGQGSPQAASEVAGGLRPAPEPRAE